MYMPTLNVTLSQVCKLSPNLVPTLLIELKEKAGWKKDWKDIDVKWQYNWVIAPKSLSFEQFLNKEPGEGEIPSCVSLTASKSYLRVTVQIPFNRVPKVILDNPNGVGEDALLDNLTK